MNKDISKLKIIRAAQHYLTTYPELCSPIYIGSDSIDSSLVDVQKRYEHLRTFAVNRLNDSYYDPLNPPVEYRVIDAMDKKLGKQWPLIKPKFTLVYHDIVESNNVDGAIT